MNDASTSRRPNLRKSIIINWRVQLALMGYAVAFSILSVIYMRVTELAFRAPEGPSPVVMGGVLAGGAFIFVGLILAGFYISNKICGPIYRVEKALREVRAGETPPPIRLRDGDEFAGLINDFNVVVLGDKPEA